MRYYDVLKIIHEIADVSTYLETGVRNGDSISLVKPDALAFGIDPNPDITRTLGSGTKIFACTSDKFFERFDLEEELNTPVDMCFLDGMHLFEFALRDFINMEALCGESSLIAVHDTYPADAVMAGRERKTQQWCGDVFKLLLALKQYRPDLEMLHLDAEPSGLLLVRGLNPASTVLRDKYAAILAEFSAFDFAKIEARKQAVLSVVSYNEDVLRQFVGPRPNRGRATGLNVQPATPSAANYLFAKSGKKKRVQALGVLLCYNDGDFLAESIEYLLSQNHHIIAWDHGSSDETSAVLDRYQGELVARRYIPRNVDFYDLYHLMSHHIITHYVKTYDIISWPDQDEILEGPFRDRSYHDYLLEFYDSPFTWIRFNNMNFWYSVEDGDDPKTINRVKRYSNFIKCSPRIRAWKAKATNIRLFNHNPLGYGAECPLMFNLRHYPFRTAEQMERRIRVDRANLQRGLLNSHYNAMKSKLEFLQAFDAAKELHFDDGKELNRKPAFDWWKIYGQA